MSSLHLKNVNKIYTGGFQAVTDFNLDIEDGEFIALVGPSGCGKSTTLRMIAGLEEISSGDLILGDKKINNIAPADRNIAMVFQNYALYGNMTTYENIGFSLIVRKFDDDDIHKAVMQAAHTVEMKENLNRKPSELSGGQRQRVALGRGIVKESELFLMDEPLSNLDAKLRNKTRKEIVKITKEKKATVVYVTHDQIEAMAMADRIVIMDSGVIQQVGTPLEVYTDPNNIFVAGFIGTPPTNFVEGIFEDGKFKNEFFELELNEKCIKLLAGYENKKIVLGVRPEDLYVDVINIVDQNEKKILPKNDPSTKALIELLEYLGKEYIVHLKIGELAFKANMNVRAQLEINQTIDLKFNLENCYFFDIETTNRIRSW